MKSEVEKAVTAKQYEDGENDGDHLPQAGNQPGHVLPQVHIGGCGLEIAAAEFALKPDERGNEPTRRWNDSDAGKLRESKARVSSSKQQQ